MINFERKNYNTEKYKELPGNDQAKRAELLVKKAGIIEEMRKTLGKMRLKSRSRIGSIKVGGSSPIDVENSNNYGESNDFKDFEGRKANKIKEPLEKLLNYIYDRNVESFQKMENQAEDHKKSIKETEINNSKGEI